MSELREAIQRLCYDKVDGYAAFYSYCTSCHEISAETPFPHASDCPVEVVQAALDAHEAEYKALVAIKDAVLFGDPLEYAIAHGFRASIEMHKIRYTEGIKAALESYQAATE